MDCPETSSPDTGSSVWGHQEQEDNEWGVAAGGNLCVQAEAGRDIHSLCSSGAPPDYVVFFTYLNRMETTYLQCCTAHSKAPRPKSFYCCFLNHVSSSCILASCFFGHSLILWQNCLFYCRWYTINAFNIPSHQPPIAPSQITSRPLSRSSCKMRKRKSRCSYLFLPQYVHYSSSPWQKQQIDLESSV